MTDLQIELVLAEGSNDNLDIFATLSGHRIPLWLSDDGPREVLVTRITGDGGTPQRITVEAHCAEELAELPPATESTFLGWRVESLTER
jgi:hypothetical protein